MVESSTGDQGSMEQEMSHEMKQNNPPPQIALNEFVVSEAYLLSTGPLMGRQGFPIIRVF